MTTLVTLQQASDHLRTDTDDPMLEIYLLAASEAVMKYIEGPGVEGFTDSAGALVPDSSGTAIGVPYQIQAATLLLTGYMYRLRDDNDNSSFRAAFEFGFLPIPVTSLLHPFRTPSLG